MKTRSPWGLYAALFATSGLFGYVWLFLLLRDVNELRGRRVFPVWEIGLIGALVLIVYFVLPFIPYEPAEISGMPHERLIAIACLALSLLFGPALLLVAVSRQIDAANGRQSAISSDLNVFFLTIFMFISYPLVQQRMNDVIGNRTRNEAGVSA